MLRREEIAYETCPFCPNPSHDVYWEQVTIEDDTATQRGTCSDCGETWVEIYDFVGVAFDLEKHPA